MSLYSWPVSSSFPSTVFPLETLFSVKPEDVFVLFILWILKFQLQLLYLPLKL